jgi:hypothetical protein
MQHFKTIEIDLDVYKRIEENRKSFDQSENDILRHLLDLEEQPIKMVRGNKTGLNIGDGVVLPDGTQLRKKYKGQLYEVTVTNGRIIYNGKGYTSPSGAAVAITGSPVNGWRFWEVKKPDDNEYRPLAELR